MGGRTLERPSCGGRSGHLDPMGYTKATARTAILRDRSGAAVDWNKCVRLSDLRSPVDRGAAKKPLAAIL